MAHAPAVGGNDRFCAERPLPMAVADVLARGFAAKREVRGCKPRDRQRGLWRGCRRASRSDRRLVGLIDLKTDRSRWRGRSSSVGPDRLAGLRPLGTIYYAERRASRLTRRRSTEAVREDSPPGTGPQGPRRRRRSGCRMRSCRRAACRRRASPSLWRIPGAISSGCVQKRRQRTEGAGRDARSRWAAGRRRKGV